MPSKMKEMRAIHLDITGLRNPVSLSEGEGSGAVSPTTWHPNRVVNSQCDAPIIENRVGIVQPNQLCLQGFRIKRDHHESSQAVGVCLVAHQDIRTGQVLIVHILGT